MPETSDDFDKFWEIATESGIEDLNFPNPLAEIQPEDVASVLQTVNEMGSWLSHYLMISLHKDESQIPPTLYPSLAIIQSLSRQIVAELSPCHCAACSPKE